MQFDDLRLAEPILRAIRAESYHTATPIQARAIPPILEGRDVVGCAQTGTGKTAAFALPVLQRLTEQPVDHKHPRCLVLAPTRELACQILESFRTYGRYLKLRYTAVYGGVNQNPQVKSLKRGVDVLIATPGRLMDLMDQGHIDLRRADTLILDEADRMLDMGFMPDIKRIVPKMSSREQTLLFSATMPDEIRKFADTILRDPVTVEVAAQSTAADRIDQCVYFVNRKNKPALLVHLLNNMSVERAIVFTRTKHGADRVAKHLNKKGTMAAAIHGNKTQNARRRTLDQFRDGRLHVLVATDIASRGIDVDGISHVINFDLTHEPESYVHRIGRTARAGASGMAVSFCDVEERGQLRAIQRLIREEIPVRDDGPDHLTEAKGQVETNQSQSGSQRSRSRGQSGKQSGGRPRRNRNRNRSGNGGRGRNRETVGAGAGGGNNARGGSGAKASRGQGGNRNRNRRRRNG